MKFKILSLFLAIILVACKNGNDNNKNKAQGAYSTPTKKSLTDPFRWLQLNRESGTRYNPVDSSIEKIRLDDLPEGVMAIVNESTFTRRQVIRYLLDRKVDLNIPPPNRDDVIENACSN